MLRQFRRVLVDRTEPRDVERLLRDLPAEPPAEHHVGLVDAQERREPLLAGREEQVDPERRNHVRVRQRSVRGGVVRALLGRPLSDHGDRLVAEVAQERDEALRDRLDVRDDDNAHVRRH